MKHFAPLLLTSLLVAPAALADAYQTVLPEQSQINFKYTQMGVGMEGRFRQFDVQLDFDPAQPAGAKVLVEVPLASIDTGTPEADVEAAGKDWFNIKAFPVARFEAASVKPLGGNRYSVVGRLSIKGKTRDVTVPATFTTQGDTGVFAGTLSLRRGDFAIGEGAWSAFDIVANEVDVQFRISARRN